MGAVALRFWPATGGASDDGVLASFMTLAVSASAGVSTVDSTIWGVWSGDEAGLESAGVAAVSWGNVRRESGDSLRMAILVLAGFADIFRVRKAGGSVVAMGGDGSATGGWWW